MTTIGERARAIAACRNGVVPGSHLHVKIVSFASKQMREVEIEATKKALEIAAKVEKDMGERAGHGGVAHATAYRIWHDIDARLAALEGRK